MTYLAIFLALIVVPALWNYRYWTVMEPLETEGKAAPEGVEA
jgi:hypothetical protein